MPKEPRFSGRSFLRTLSLAFFGIAALFTIDTFLAKTERAEERNDAARLFREGKELMEQGRSQESIGRFKNAVSIERDDREYRLALAEAFQTAEQFEDAEATLAGLLQQDSTDGQTNLTMARVLEKQGRVTDAVSFFHRAIYGQWKVDPAQNRVKARFELIDLLIRQNAKEELLAELLPLQDETPSDLDARKRIGQLFLTAASPSHATAIFRDVLRRHPRDADAYAGLGEAEFSQGNCQTALAEFVAASRLKPGDEHVRQRMELCNKVLSIDPTPRGLPAFERYARSVRLIELALAETEPCVGTAPAQSAVGLLDDARKAARRHVATSQQSEAYEEDLDLLERIWRIHKTACAQRATEGGQILDLVLEKLAQ